MKCRGNCGNEAIYGYWCNVDYRQCVGYKKKLSDKARVRGNNGVRGSLSRLFTEDDLILKTYEFVCVDCGNKFQRELKLYHTKVKRLGKSWKPVCDKCCIIRKLNTEKKKKEERIRDLIYNNRYEDIEYNNLKKIVWLEQDEKCNSCGYNKYSIKIGPYELHHKDGNHSNNTRSNIEVLCRNCHAMTDNFIFRNKKHSQETIEKIKETIKKNKEINCPIV